MTDKLWKKAQLHRFDNIEPFCTQIQILDINRFSCDDHAQNSDKTNVPVTMQCTLFNKNLKQQNTSKTWTKHF